MNQTLVTSRSKLKVQDATIIHSLPRRPTLRKHWLEYTYIFKCLKEKVLQHCQWQILGIPAGPMATTTSLFPQNWPCVIAHTRVTVSIFLQDNNCLDQGSTPDRLSLDSNCHEKPLKYFVQVVTWSNLWFEKMMGGQIRKHLVHKRWLWLALAIEKEKGKF